MIQAVQVTNGSVEPGDVHNLKFFKEETKTAELNINSSRLDPEPDEVFSKAFLECRGTISPDVDLGFQ